MPESFPALKPVSRNLSWMPVLQASTFRWFLSESHCLREPPKGTDFMLTISGDSMYPTYRPGDIIFVHSTEVLDYGKIGIFSLNGEMLLKKYSRKGLESLNRKYKLIRPTEGDSLYCLGQVLGIATEDYFP